MKTKIKTRIRSHAGIDYSGGYDLDEPLDNHSDNLPFETVLDHVMTRRTILKGGLGAAALSMFGLTLSSNAFANSIVPKNLASKLGFRAIDVSEDDLIHVPEGYTARVFYAWGDPISDGPEFKQDASNTAAEQLLQAGMHHDGMHFFSLPPGSHGNDHGLLVLNHEYIDPTLLHTEGGYGDSPETYTLDKANKELAAHGVSIIEIKKVNGHWEIVRPSSLARRISMHTPMVISGPAASNEWLKTADDPAGKLAIGTMNNCAHGCTPWGTFLTCEENFHGYFAGYGNDIDQEKSAWERLASYGMVPENYADNGSIAGNGDSDNLDEKTRENLVRYGIYSDAKSRYGWEKHHPRFDTGLHPNEPNRFGWVVEINPFDPTHTPVKRTALGRFRHENAAHTLAADNRVVIYMGDDATHEYIYKFVTADPYTPGDPAANRDLLDEGALYVARFDDDGTGVWLELAYGQEGLTTADGFTDQGDVLVRTRAAADAVGATPMDRPEWIAVHPDTGEVYCTLTNNSKRTEADADAANPRPENMHGHIIRWHEMGDDATALDFDWDIFVLAGDPQSTEANLQGDIHGDIFSSPDGLWIDPLGVLWVQTDISDSKQNKGEFTAFGNNQMLAVDPDDGEMRRFLTGPAGQEITGVITTPDMTAMFINVQHPGDVPAGMRDLGIEKTPENPTAASSWPDGPGIAGRPRSATVLITKDDGGIIGT